MENIKLYKCPCCGYNTLTEEYNPKNGTGYDICPLCGWEDDGTIDVNSVRSINGGSISDYRKRLSLNFINNSRLEQYTYLYYLVDNERWYYELDEDRYAIKQIVINDEGYHLSCFEECLAEVVVDPDGFDGEGISKWISSDDFYDVWNQYLYKHAEAWNVTKTRHSLGSICSGQTKAFYPQGQLIEGSDYMGIFPIESGCIHEVKDYCVVGYDESNMWLILKQV